MWIIVYMWALGVPMVAAAISRWMSRADIAIDEVTIVVAVCAAIGWPVTALILLWCFVSALVKRGP